MSRDSRTSPNARPSGGNTEHIVVAAQRVVTHVRAASSTSPAPAGAADFTTPDLRDHRCEATGRPNQRALPGTRRRKSRRPAGQLDRTVQAHPERLRMTMLGRDVGYERSQLGAGSWPWSGGGEAVELVEGISDDLVVVHSGAAVGHRRAAGI